MEVFFLKKEFQKNPLNKNSAGTCALKIENIQMNGNIKNGFETENLLSFESKVLFENDENASLLSIAIS